MLDMEPGRVSGQAVKPPPDKGKKVIHYEIAVPRSRFEPPPHHGLNRPKEGIRI